ncbi:MAG: hypothetical protein J6J31_08895 [Thermoguttaceae bacterium]|nr:hypothetical protein [Thermoguttaceae bacterium]
MIFTSGSFRHDQRQKGDLNSVFWMYWPAGFAQFTQIIPQSAKNFHTSHPAKSSFFHKKSKKSRFFRHKSPQTALLAICRSFHRDVSGLHADAIAASTFWEGPTFFVSANGDQNALRIRAIPFFRPLTVPGIFRSPPGKLFPNSLFLEKIPHS